MSEQPQTAPADKQRLTASRMVTMGMCPRRHYWQYEVGLHRVEDAAALRFGRAWHRAMEARWQGKNCEEALTAAIGNAADANDALDAYEVAKIAGLLRAYFTLYPSYSPVLTIYPEVQFEQPIDGSRRFVAAGKIDGLCELEDGHLALIEHKTTSDSLEDESPYWLRLRCNTQVLGYVDAARAHGHDVTTVFYDVTRKPGIAPKHVPVLDHDGLKVVRDAVTGERVANKTKGWRQTGGEGYVMDTRHETPHEYAERLFSDCMERPAFYFARKLVTVLDDELNEFRESRLAVSRMILDRRRAQADTTAPYRAWPRNVNALICMGCPFAGFCLSNIVPDTANLPTGYEILTDVHPELAET